MTPADLARARDIHTPRSVCLAAVSLTELDADAFLKMSGGGALGTPTRVACDLKFAAVWLSYLMQHPEAEIAKAFAYQQPQGCRYARDMAKHRMKQPGQLGEQYRRQLGRLVAVLGAAALDKKPERPSERPSAAGMELL